MHRRLAVAATLCAAVFLAACTQQAPKPPPPTSGPTMPSDPPTSATPSPSPSTDPEKAIDDAIVRAYTESFDELNRLDMAGGATEPSQRLLDTTSGELRTALMTVLRSDKKHGIREVHPGTLTGVVVTPGTGNTRKLTACEDYTAAKWVNKDGSPVKVQQPILYLQHSIAKLGPDGKWRIDSTDTTSMKTLKHTICGGDK